MPLNAGQKAERVLKFLMALPEKPIARSMAAYGFTAADLDEGWHLLRGTRRLAVDKDPVARGIDQSKLLDLDSWENRWFPIAKTTLERRHPAVAAQLFKNLTQQVGPAVTMSVGTFLERYADLAAGKGSYGAEGTEAAKVLAQRGLTDAELEKAKALLKQIGTLDLTPEAAEEAPKDAAAFAKAEADLWQWYLEWSQVARTAISQKSTLRAMGFGAIRRSSKVDDVDDEEEVPAAPPTTNPVQPVA